MSIKSSVYASQLKAGPANKHSFIVAIPGLSKSVFARTVTYPPLQRVEVAVPCNGTTIYVPGRQVPSGEVQLTIVEDSTFETRREIVSTFLEATWNYKENGSPLNSSLTPKVTDVSKFRALLDTVLVSALSRGKTRTQTRVNMFDMFIYPIHETWMLMGPVILKGCFLKDRASVTLDASDVTTPWEWTITIRYNRMTEPQTILKNPTLVAAEQLALIQLSKIKGGEFSSIGSVMSLLTGAFT